MCVCDCVLDYRYFRPYMCTPNVTVLLSMYVTLCNIGILDNSYTGRVTLEMPSASLKTRATTINLSMHHLFFPSEHIGVLKKRNKKKLLVIIIFCFTSRDS